MTAAGLWLARARCANSKDATAVNTSSPLLDGARCELQTFRKGPQIALYPALKRRERQLFGPDNLDRWLVALFISTRSRGYEG
jgi:hypothetical protein